MEYRVLKYFLTVAQEENITRAASLLHISQPALSRQLMQLEEELGVKLFERGKRKTCLTDAGNLLRRRAEDIIELTEKTENEIRHHDSAVSGVINIGSGEAETTRVLAELMRGFTEIYPEVKFNIYSDNADPVKEKLEKGLIDIAVMLEPAEISGYEHVGMRRKERWGVYLPSKSRLAGLDKITPADLAGERVFTPRRVKTQGVREWLGEYFDQLDVYASYNLLYNAAMLVDCGIGAAIAIEGAAALYKNPDIVFRPFFPELTLSSVLVPNEFQNYF